jgi:ParB/RepB/Spo0J family partition protein
MVSLASTPVTEIPIALIDPSPLNPRTHFSGLEELAESLKVGQIDAIIVRAHPQKPGRFELANGERRWRAAGIAGKTTLEAKVRELSDSQMLDIMLGSGADGNVEKLNPLEEATGYARAREVMGLSLRGVADHFHRSLFYVQQRVALLGLPADAKAMLVDGRLQINTAWLIARIPDPVKRAEHAPSILKSPLGVMSYKDAKGYIERNVCRSLDDAPFSRDDKNLVPDAGACTGCSFNTANDRETYGDTSTNRCMSPACFENKVGAARARVLAQEEKAGKKPLAPEVNAQVFPSDAQGLAWNSGHVEFSKRPPEDLLKGDVTPTKAPTWRELCGDRVTVHVGIDQAGRAVDVVKLDEALAAVLPEEVAIFRDEVVRKHSLAKSAPSTKAERSTSQLEKESTEQKLREKAERAAKLRQKKARAWLDDLVLALEARAAAKKPAWGSYVYWSLMFERMLASIGDEDVVFLCDLFGAAGAGDTRQALGDIVGKLSAGKCGALVTAMVLAPWLRAQGPDAAFVTEWHDAFLVEEGASADVAEDDVECRKSAGDVVANGTLNMAVSADVTPCSASLCMAAFEAAGITTAQARNRITKTATTGRVKTFDAITAAEDFEKVTAMLARAGKATSKPAAVASDGEE